MVHVVVFELYTHTQSGQNNTPHMATQVHSLKKYISYLSVKQYYFINSSINLCFEMRMNIGNYSPSLCSCCFLILMSPFKAVRPYQPLSPSHSMTACLNYEIYYI